MSKLHSGPSLRYQSIDSSYFPRAFTHPSRLVRLAREALKDIEFDTVVGTGLSGALVLPVIGPKVGNHWALIRKTNEPAHSSNTIVGSIGKRWIFVDDFISSGSSMIRCIRAIYGLSSSWWGNTAIDTEFVGSLTYEHAPWRFTSSRELTKAYGLDDLLEQCQQRLRSQKGLLEDVVMPFTADTGIVL